MFPTLRVKYPFEVPVILLTFYLNLNFLYMFSKNFQMSSFTKIRPVGAELFHADRRTDGHNEAKSRFSQIWVPPSKRPERTPQQGSFRDALNTLTRGAEFFSGS